ncbi:acyl-CoA-binding domain-containing protein 4 [Apophysomyces ossiformis]|uniref:Acyl-CoA-binding domain-containing protein 4 n=1 Tax=Apophysomyces ossiformis TaxID=679940 RepID=A0A8H7BGT9_9FUNG|nr:acyl-CoA-binding domain-containing protein 4 [Apophysomyces ossiformis]
MVPLRQFNGYLLYMGLGPNNTGYLRNEITTYNADTDTWTNIPTNLYQIIDPMATMDDQERIWIWSGMSNSWVGNPQPASIRQWIWYMNTTLQPGDDVVNARQVPQDILRMQGTATASRDQKRIYYIGGVNASPNPNKGPNGTDPYVVHPALMGEILMFDTTTTSWSINNAYGDIPSGRVYHTAVHLPAADAILLYGGAQYVQSTQALGNPTTTVDDYCYMLNLTNMTWTKITNLGPLKGAGPRFGHSAVVHGNRSMFVFFGTDNNGNEHGDFHVMDLQTLQWVPKYSAKDQYLYVPANASTTPLPGGTSAGGLSRGAIAGIVVGAVVGVAAIVVAAFLWIRRKRNQSDAAKHSGSSSEQAGANVTKEQYYNMDETTTIYKESGGNNKESSHIDDSEQSRIIDEDTSFIPPPAFTSNEHQKSTTSPYIATPTTLAANTSVEDYDLGPDKPDAYVPRYTLAPVKPDGI